MDTKGEQSGRTTPVRSSEDDFERKLSASFVPPKSSERRSAAVEHSDTFQKSLDEPYTEQIEQQEESKLEILEPDEGKEEEHHVIAAP